MGSRPARLWVELNLPRPHGASFLRLGVTIANRQEPHLLRLGVDILGSRDIHDTIFLDVLDIRRPSHSVDGFLIEMAFKSATQDWSLSAHSDAMKITYAPTGKGVQDVPVMGDRDLRAFQVGETFQKCSLGSTIPELDNVSSCRVALILSDIMEEGNRRRFSRRFRHWLRYDLPSRRCSHFIARPLSKAPGLKCKAANSME